MLKHRFDNFRSIDLSRDDVGTTPRLSLLLATTCGLIAANIQYMQPPIGPTTTGLQLSARAAGRFEGGYMASLSSVGAIGLALWAWTYGEAGWPLTLATGLLLPVLALKHLLTDESELEQ